METNNVFEHISQHIIKHIQNAKNSIHICVPWLTDPEILVQLIEKAKQNVAIEIISVNDEINLTKSFYFNKLIANDAKVYLVDKTSEGGIPHHKFCVIDNDVLITGSYNWSNNARRNDENILVKVADDEDDFWFIQEYLTRFQEMLYKYGVKEENEDWDEVIRITDAAKTQQDAAPEYFEIAQRYFHEGKYADALDFINEGIGMLPYPDSNYFLLKHIILMRLRSYLEGAEELFSYLSTISKNDIDEIDRFKRIYQEFIERIKRDGHESYKAISGINVRTKSAMGNFSILNITPYFLSYDELDVFPF